MKNTQSQIKRSRRALPLALFGLFLGAGLAYALVQWRRALMPEMPLQPGPEGVSIYEVSGDVTRDWPVSSGAIGCERVPSGDSRAGLPCEEGGLQLWN